MPNIRKTDSSRASGRCYRDRTAEATVALSRRQRWRGIGCSAGATNPQNRRSSDCGANQSRGPLTLVPRRYLGGGIRGPSDSNHLRARGNSSRELGILTGLRPRRGERPCCGPRNGPALTSQSHACREGSNVSLSHLRQQLLNRLKLSRAIERIDDCRFDVMEYLRAFDPTHLCVERLFRDSVTLLERP